MPAPEPLLEVLAQARELAARPENDFTWSSWRGAEDALAEIDGHIADVRGGRVDVAAIAGVFLPTGPLQELAISSGWGAAFLAVADRFDAAVASAP